MGRISEARPSLAALGVVCLNSFYLIGGRGAEFAQATIAEV
jgi:hypothetical protein